MEPWSEAITLKHWIIFFGAIAEYPATLATPCIRLRIYTVTALQNHWRQGYVSSVSTSWNFNFLSSLKNWLRVYACKIYSYSRSTIKKWLPVCAYTLWKSIHTLEVHQKSGYASTPWKFIHTLEVHQEKKTRKKWLCVCTSMLWI